MFLKLSLNTFLILMSNSCSLHVKPLGITDNAVLYSFILSFALPVLWVVALSITNSAFHYKLKIKYFLNASAINFITICSLSHAFSCQNINLFIYTLYLLIFFSIFSFLCFKINKGASFLWKKELLKLQLFFSFLVPVH